MPISVRFQDRFNRDMCFLGWLGYFFFGRWVDFVAFDIVYEEKSSFFEYVFNTIILEICNTYYVSYIRDIIFFYFNFVSIIFKIC